MGVHPRTHVCRAADCALDPVAIRPREIPSDTRSRTPSRGAVRGCGDRQPGVFASLDPRLMSVTPIGVGVLEQPGRSKTTSRKPGPLCPADGRPSENPRVPGGGLCPGSGGHSTARNSFGHAFTPPSRGAGRGCGNRQSGVFASLDPRLMSVTPTGVENATASPPRPPEGHSLSRRTRPRVSYCRIGPSFFGVPRAGTSTTGSSNRRRMSPS
jgi:hypothetical protein